MTLLEFVDLLVGFRLRITPTQCYPPRMDKAIGGMLYFRELRQSATDLKRPTAFLARLLSCGFYVSKIWSMLNTVNAMSRQGHLNTETSQSV